MEVPVFFIISYSVPSLISVFRTGALSAHPTSSAPANGSVPLNDLTAQLRLKRPRQALQMLERLQKQHYITFSLLARGRVVKLKSPPGRKSNTVLDYNAPLSKGMPAFFFFPIAILNELIGMGKCSELDILLDLWLHTVYRDERVRGLG